MTIDIDNIPRTIDLVHIESDACADKGDAGRVALCIIDQTKLPYVEEYLYLTDWRDVIEAIKQLKVRGAPAIGIAGAGAVALAAVEYCGGAGEGVVSECCRTAEVEGGSSQAYLARMREAAHAIATARPTAVNLQHMVDAAMEIVEEEVASDTDPVVIAEALYEFTKQLISEDENANRTMGEFGASLLQPDSCVLTHCNAGSLATAFFGTALGVIYEAALQGKISMVYADETRPLRQGARLSAFELAKARVPVTVICDNMAAATMAQGRVDAVFVGADRIATNGDTANKIGTLGVAIAAARYDIPFYVVAPTSTIDSKAHRGSDIPIEERDALEVLDPPIPGVAIYNPAFDVTPAELITAIVTEKGIVVPSEVGTLVAATDK